ncbi:MAG: carbohydrate ABC transporter permease [Clostridiales bacterium]|jgi:putative aldouronate transport system permease protein|nr:carbohydrate ABC transporter permease [Clostridiales bacterium]
MTARSKERIYQGVCATVCVLVASVCVYPLLYTLIVSFCDPAHISFLGILPLPSQFSLTAYVKVFSAGSYISKAILVSVFRTAVGTVGSVLLCSLFAYALSRKGLPGRKPVMYLLIFVILFNGGLIPTYFAIRQVGLLDNIWVYVFPNLINAWNVIIIKQSMEAVPKEIEESAQMDGVSDLRNFINIVLPMSKPVLAAMAIFTMVGQWNSWFDAMIYVSSVHSSLWPLQYYTTISFNNLNQINQGGTGDVGSIIGIEDINNMSIKMALTVVTCLPILAVYPFFQKYFTKGVYLGAVKG